VSFLFWASDSVGARTVSSTFSMAYSVMFRVNWPDLISAMSSTVLMRLPAPAAEANRNAACHHDAADVKRLPHRLVGVGLDRRGDLFSWARS